MKILYLNPVGVLGGGERSLLDLLAVLRTARPNWSLHLIAGTDGPLLEEASKLGVASQVVAMPAALTSFGDSGLARGERGRLSRALTQARRAASALAATPGYVRRLRSAVHAIRPDLVHSNGIKSHLVAGMAARGTPVIWHIRDFLSSRALVGKGLRNLTHKPTLALANSEAVKLDTERTLPGVRVESVYNGIDTVRFIPDGEVCANLDRLAGMSDAIEGTLRIGLVGTYARWKGQDVLIEAMAILRSRRDLPPLRCYIIGAPLYQTAGSQFSEAELRERIRLFNLPEVVGLVPFQRDLPPMYRALDIVVHASTKPEPFGRTIVEAMACGRAVVVSNAGGAAELFTHGVDALGTPPGNATALADAIASLAIDSARRGEFGIAARKSAVARFSREAMGERVLAIYDSHLTSRSS